MTLRSRVSRAVRSLDTRLDLALLLSALGICFGIAVSLVGFPLEGAAFAVLSWAPVCWVTDRRTTPSMVFGPVSYFFAFHALGYALGPVGQRYLSVGPVNFLPNGMVHAQWGAVAGLGAFLALYPYIFHAAERFGKRQSHKPIVSNDPKWVGFTKLITVAAFLLLVYTHFAATGRRLGTFDDAGIGAKTVAAAFSDITLLAFILLAMTAGRRRGTWLWIWGASLALYAAYYFLEGSRGPVLVAILTSIIGFGLSGIPRRRLAVVLAGTLVVLGPISSVVVNYRSQSQYSSQYDKGLAARARAFSAAADELDERSRNRETSSTQILLESVTALTVDSIMELTPDRVPFAGFRDVDRIFYVWVPTVIYPERPSLGDGNEIALEYGVGHDSGKSWVYTPTVGDGYRRFGWVGVPLLYGLLALLYGSLLGFSWARRHERTWASVFLIGFLEIPSAWSSTLLSMAYQAAWTFPKYILLFWILQRLQDFFGRMRIEVGGVPSPQPPVRLGG